MNPGRKDNLYVGKINDERKYKQKRYLLWTIRHLILSMVLDGKIKILKSSVMFLRSICLSPSYVITWKVINRTFLTEICLLSVQNFHARVLCMLIIAIVIKTRNNMKFRVHTPNTPVLVYSLLAVIIKVD